MSVGVTLDGRRKEMGSDGMLVVDWIVPCAVCGAAVRHDSFVVIESESCMHVCNQTQFMVIDLMVPHTEWDGMDE